MESSDVVQQYCLKWNNHHSTLVNVLDLLLKQESLCDVTLAAEGKSVKVHRLVLCACSTYFKELLCQEWDKQAIIFLKDVKFNQLEALVDYMYHGEVCVAQEQLAEFVSTAEALGIEGLADVDKGSVPEQKKRLPSSAPSASSSPRPVKRANTRSKEDDMAPPATFPPPALAWMPQHVDAVIEDNQPINNVNLTPNLDKGADTFSEFGQIESTSGLASGTIIKTEDGGENWSENDQLAARGHIETLDRLDPQVEIKMEDDDETWSENDQSVVRDLTKEEGRYACPNCHRTYAAQHNLVRHVRYECGQPPRYTCSLCMKGFKRKEGLNRHWEKFHAQPSSALYQNIL